MNYVNKGRRDVLIFPDFDNIEEIERIRMQFDELYGIVPPHITLAFPFESSMSNEELEYKLNELLKDVEPFYVEMGGVSLSKDVRVNTNYIFLNFITGQDKIIDIHNKIYDEILKKKLDFDYVPHITLGCTQSEVVPVNIASRFRTTVSKLSVELIGENEESNIIFDIELNYKKKKFK